MSIDEYHVMEHRLGWKHEYWDGAAQLSCQATAVAKFRLDLASRVWQKAELDDHLVVRRVKAEDESGLLNLFLRAFDEGIEYAGYEQIGYEQAVQKSIDSFFGSAQSVAPEHSFVALKGNTAIAAGLVRRRECGSILELIMVEPNHHRIGLGSRILSKIAHSLLSAGESVLHSRCHLGNSASFNWHERCGFRELPDFFAANHRALHYHWQARHFYSQNQPERAAKMHVMAEHWEKVAETEQLSFVNSTKRRSGESLRGI